MFENHLCPKFLKKKKERENDAEGVKVNQLATNKLDFSWIFMYQKHCHVAEEQKGCV